ncbi:hypothetical protein FRC01_008971 [Tulasnella sp. 417]|nr:hypothetical protein FRC01_008971 [Tulasnella sp. 417]
MLFDLIEATGVSHYLSWRRWSPEKVATRARTLELHHITKTSVNIMASDDNILAILLETIAGKKRSRQSPRLPSTAPTGSIKLISGLKRIVRKVSPSTISSTSSASPKAKRKKTSTSVDSAIEDSSGGPTLPQAVLLLGEKRETVGKGEDSDDEESELDEEGVFGTDEGSSDDGSEVGSEESEGRATAEPSQKEIESKSRPDESRSEEGSSNHTSDEGDPNEDGEEPISLSQTHLALSAAISALGSAVGKVQELSVSPESTRAAVEARSEWEGSNHPRYDIFERKYDQGKLESDDIKKLVEMFEADMILAEKIRRAVEDEVEVATRVSSLVTGLLDQ